MIPVSPAAFSAAQPSSKRALKHRYIGALVISRDGQVLPIESVEVIGLWGSSLYRKCISALSGAWSIKVRFGPARPMTLDEFKSLVVRYLGYDQEPGKQNFPQTELLEVVSSRLRAAASFSDVFDQLPMPEPEDALDVL